MPSDVRIVVVFPEPLGPSRPKIVPGSTVRSRPSRARVRSKVFTSPRQISAGVAMVWRNPDTAEPKPKGRACTAADPRTPSRTPSPEHTLVRRLVERDDHAGAVPRANQRRRRPGDGGAQRAIGQHGAR